MIDVFITGVEKSDDCLYWGQLDITNRELHDRILRLDNVKQFKKMLLNGNNITTCDLKQHQFLQLTILKAPHNKIMEMNDLPNTITHLDLSHNEIANLGGLPNTITNLKLSHNEITEVCGLPKGTSHLDLSHNKIVSVKEIPRNIKSCTLVGNPIQIFEHASFPSKKVLPAIKSALSDDQIEMLKQPPPEVFRSEYHNISEYFSDIEMSSAVETSTARLDF